MFHSVENGICRGVSIMIIFLDLQLLMHVKKKSELRTTNIGPINKYKPIRKKVKLLGQAHMGR